MRHSWPKGTRFKEVRLDVQDRSCQTCDGPTYVKDYKDRRIWTLDGPQKLVSQMTLCGDNQCDGSHELFIAEVETLIAPPRWILGWDAFAQLGHRRFAKSWSVPEIQEELVDVFGIRVSADCIEDYIGRYQVILAARQNDPVRLAAEYAKVSSVILSIDGLQPEKGHETLYTVRDLTAKRVWFAEALVSSSAAEVTRLLERAKEWAANLGKPVRAWVSDKQDAFVTGIAALFPGVPHRYCQNHFLRDVAEAVLDLDSTAKVRMRKKVRGLRAIERELLEAQQPKEEPVTPQTDTAEQVALDYCTAVRGILNKNQGGPLDPPGLRMADSLSEVRESIQASLDAGVAGNVTSKLERLNACIDRGLSAIAGVPERTRSYVQDLAAVFGTLDPEKGSSEQRETQFASMLERFRLTQDPVLISMGKVMENWQLGLFAGGDGLDHLRDNLDLERWFRYPKAHQRKIHGHKHVGTSVVEEGPSLLLALDAHLSHRRPFDIEELVPYFGARPSVGELVAIERRKIMRRASSRKQRKALLTEFERRLRTQAHEQASRVSDSSQTAHHA